jgi:hypothetical protein
MPVNSLYQNLSECRKLSELFLRLSQLFLQLSNIVLIGLLHFFLVSREPVPSSCRQFATGLKTMSSFVACLVLGLHVDVVAGGVDHALP